MIWKISDWFEKDRTREKEDMREFLLSDKASNGKKWWINQAFGGDIDAYMKFMQKSNRSEEYVLNTLKLLNPEADVKFLDENRDYICTEDPSHGKPDIQFNDVTIEVKQYKVCVDEGGYYVYTEASTDDWDLIWKLKFHGADYVIDVSGSKKIILDKSSKHEIMNEHMKGTHREWYVKIYEAV